MIVKMDIFHNILQNYIIIFHKEELVGKLFIDVELPSFSNFSE